MAKKALVFLGRSGSQSLKPDLGTLTPGDAKSAPVSAQIERTRRDLMLACLESAHATTENTKAPAHQVSTQSLPHRPILTQLEDEETRLLLDDAFDTHPDNSLDQTPAQPSRPQQNDSAKEINKPASLGDDIMQQIVNEDISSHHNENKI